MELIYNACVLALASYNIAYALTREDGFTVYGVPIFFRIREWAGVKYDEYSNPYGETDLAKLFSCIKCMSRWTSLTLVLGFFLLKETFVILMLPFALSTVVMVLYDTSENRN